MIAFLIRLLTGAHARWVGCAPEIRQRIYFANHCSHLDAPVIWASLHPHIRRQVRMIAARDYWDRGPIRRFLAHKVFNALLINRKKVTRDDNPINDMETALKSGSSLIIFPEGTRQDDEDADMNPFKAGIYHLAKRCPDIEFIPVHLDNLNRIMPKGEYLVAPLMATVTFGEAIQLKDKEGKQEFLERARLAVKYLADVSEDA